jgi:predicted HicB family RNase H-like nuclease
MAVKINSKPSPAVKTKARQLLTFAKERAQAGNGSAELFIVIFGPQGKARFMFPNKTERAAFERTAEHREIRKLIEMAASSSVGDEPDMMTNGHLTVTLRLPKSVHAALLAEAAAEGVSLDQLCLSKLVAQLRELV